MTGVSSEAQALEIQAPPLVQSSPPDQAGPRLEPLTPSPVTLSPQLDQVMVNFSAYQRPLSSDRYSLRRGLDSDFFFRCFNTFFQEPSIRAETRDK